MKKWIRNLLIILAVLVILNYIGERRDKWEENNCELTFNTYTYNVGCASTCSLKCSDEGFPYTSSSYFYPSLSAEEMANTELYKSCECNCGGCREKWNINKKKFGYVPLSGGAFVKYLAGEKLVGLTALSGWSNYKEVFSA